MTITKKLLCLVALLVMTGCPPGPPIVLKTLTLNPTNVSFGYQEHDTSSWECAGSIGTFGTGPETAMPGEALAGWEDLYVPGSDPLPCNYNQQMLYRGHVEFDGLRQFDSVVTATLLWNVDESENQTGLASLDIPAISYPTILGMATAQSQGSNGQPYWWNDDPATEVSLPACQQSLIKPDCQLGVSWQVNQWTSQQMIDLGFEVIGPKLSIDDPLPNDNNAQLSWLGNWHLTVLYNPALNPRAPQ